MCTVVYSHILNYQPSYLLSYGYHSIVQLQTQNFVEVYCAIRLQSPWSGRCFRDPEFSHFVTVPACGGQTDGQTQGHSIYCASKASRG